LGQIDEEGSLVVEMVGNVGNVGMVGFVEMVRIVEMVGRLKGEAVGNN
jgi:hypothetical protein